MNEKDKAIEIAKQYLVAMGSQNYPTAINCAIIHVKGIIEEVDRIHFRFIMDNEKTRKYWQQVLTELNKM